MSNVVPIPPHAEKVFQGIIHSIWQWEQPLYDGTTATFERIERPDAAMAVGVTPDKTIILVRDEQPDRAPVICPAGGRVEPGEVARAAAKRELLEETGYTCSDIVPWFTVSPHKAAFTAHFFIARGAVYQQPPRLDGGEKCEVLSFNFDEFLQLGHDPTVREPLLRILLLEALYNDAKQTELRQLLYGRV